ncbi:MAG: hydroxyacid dehydrogenase [Verrucomicrobia bacterium]|nr:hydroxyacid dehydrogenase [Verrucomicrobiota bacterium]
MKISFVSAGSSDESFFHDELRDHELEFVRSMGEVSSEAEILSPFIYDQVNLDFLEGHPALRLVCTRSAGWDHIDLELCRRRGVAVANVPAYGANTVAEHTFALILSLSRRLREAGLAVPDRSPVEALRGFDLKGKTIGVIGTGRIGSHVIRLANGFGMRVLACDAFPNTHLADLLGFEYTALEDLLPQAQVITLHCPLRPDTFHLLNRERLSRCLPGVLIINTARGNLIDTEALIAALEAGHVGGAGLDVLEGELATTRPPSLNVTELILEELHAGLSPEEYRLKHPNRIQDLQQMMRNKVLISRPNVVFTPHVAFNSFEAADRINRTTMENVRAFLKGKPINLVTPA